MLKINDPEDLLGISIKNMLEYRKNDKKFNDFIIKWGQKKSKKFVINILPFYPITVIFSGNEVMIKKEDAKKALKITMDIHHMLDIAYNRLGVIKATLTRKVKIKGIYRIGTLLKFMKIILKTMKMVAAEPNTNYFELHKTTR